MQLLGNITEILCTLYPVSPDGSCKTIVQYQYQDIDIDTVKKKNISITIRIYMLPFSTTPIFLPPPSLPQSLATINLFSISIFSSFQAC